MTKLSVIISYYKALDNLKIILKAFNQQSCKEFEVILSEDDYNEETLEYIKLNEKNFTFPIIHLFQKEDKGFRKNEMLNKSLICANSEKVAFIDGDCIPHRHFVLQYIKSTRKNGICIGRSVFLGEKISKSILEIQSLKRLNFFSLLFSDSTKIKEGIYFPLFHLTTKLKGIVGRNWGIYKSALVDINGFDKDYQYAGIGEDCDIEWRLLKKGNKKISVKNKAIVYHIHHGRWYSTKAERNNYRIMLTKMEENNVRCLNGINNSYNGFKYKEK